MYSHKNYYTKYIIIFGIYELWKYYDFLVCSQITTQYDTILRVGGCTILLVIDCDLDRNIPSY